MKRLVRCGRWALFALVGAWGARGQHFDAALIPPELSRDAHAVLRQSATTFDVKSPGAAVEHRRRVITVLDEAGRPYATAAVAYDKFRKLKALSARLLDGNGRVLRTLKRGDFEDVPATSGTSLYDDNRVAFAELADRTYPFTVDLEYELEHDGLLDWPDWTPQFESVGVELSLFELRVPEGMEIRYRARHMDLQPEVRQERGTSVYRWTARGLPPWKAEPWGPSWEAFAPRLITAPPAFEIEGHRGDMTTWERFGRWYAALNAGRDVLPEAERARLLALVAGAENDRETVRRLYEDLQRRTRYVSVQLGLGGWQTFDARYVLDRGYGDCKALVNHMKAMLAAVGIASVPALVRAGTGVPDIDPEFSHHAFDHVVLAVPLATRDTVWLETTSRTMPFGRLGAFTEGRFALLAAPRGSRLVRTPGSAADDNRQARHAAVAITPTGSATMQVRTRYTGNQQDRLRNALTQVSGTDRLEWLGERISLPGARLTQADFSGFDRGEPVVDIPMTVEAPRLASRAGARLLLQPNLFERWATVPPRMEEPRSQPVRLFSYPFSDVDSLLFCVPSWFVLEAGLDPVSIETDFARYEASLAAQPDGSLLYVRRVSFYETELPASEYEAFRDFMQRMVESDRAQIVLKEKER